MQRHVREIFWFKGQRSRWNSRFLSFLPESHLLCCYYQPTNFCVFFSTSAVRILQSLVHLLTDIRLQYLTFNLTLNKPSEFAVRNSSPLPVLYLFKYFLEERIFFYFLNSLLFQVDLSLGLFNRVYSKVLYFRKKEVMYSIKT